MDILALADDLTGALEAGAQFAAAGAETVVTVHGGMPAEAAVLVIDTETRHLRPKEAAERVYEPARAALDAGARMIYKKTDSTLRGNIGAELGALVRAGGGAPLLYIPAYPEMGRTVRRGRLYVGGVPVNKTAFARDPLNPVGDSHIARVLARQTSAPIRVRDGETDQDVEAAARAAIPRRMAAGPAALAGALARLLFGDSAPRPAWPAVSSALVVNGSPHEVSRRQVEHALANGWAAGGAWSILETAATATVLEALERIRPEALIVFGGDTAFRILEALGRPAIHPAGEVLPGVPLSHAACGGRSLCLVTKAGGFGPPDVLARIREIIGRTS